MDRNSFSAGRESDTKESLSARRAWIEIIGGSKVVIYSISRSPQGERG